MRTTLALIPLTILLAACGGSGDKPTPPAAPAAAPAASTVAATPAAAPATAAAAPVPRGEFAFAGGAGAKAVANVGTDGNNATVTRLLVADADNDGTRGIHYIAGSWSLPVPVGGEAPEGIDWNANRAVLQSTDVPSRFVTLPLDTDKTHPTVIDLAKDGTFRF